MYFKQDTYSIQQGVKLFGQKEKDSTMKEMKNLTLKNQCFGKVEYESLA